MEVTEMEATGMGQAAWASVVQARRPVKVAGLVAEWPAIRLWQGAGGLERMGRLAGGSAVQVMRDEAGDGVFYGSLMSHTREMSSFSFFLDSVKSCLLCEAEPPKGGGGCYLAQAPIIKPQGGSTLEGPLSSLMQDFSVPPQLQREPLSECNLWMNSMASRSSTHYDPYHNLLCVVAGTKSVTLHSPRQTRCLYPEAAFGEASNHSRVDFLHPDLQRHPDFSHAAETQLQACLEPGDGLFIPEGWWHQVDSTPCTIAVNFWWRSAAAEAIGGESNAFFLREALAAAVSAEKDRLVASVEPHSLGHPPGDARLDREDRGSPGASRAADDEGQPEAKRWCQEASLDCLKAHRARGPEAGQVSPGSPRPSDVCSGEETSSTSACPGSGEGRSPQRRTLSNREAMALRLLVLDMSSRMAGERQLLPAGSENGGSHDLVARVVAGLTPAELRQVLEGMVETAPRALEMLWLYGLTPLGAELVTRKFEATSSSGQAEGADSESGDDRSFYQRVYSVCEDQRQLMAALVQKKEAFSATACLEVFTRQLSLSDLMQAVSAASDHGTHS